MTEKDQKERVKQPGLRDVFERLRMTIGTLKEQKADIEKVVNSREFSESFNECFNIGGFSAPVSFTEGLFRVSIKPVDASSRQRDHAPDDPVDNDKNREDRWAIIFSIQVKMRFDHITMWREAKISEIISCWDHYSPLLAQAIKEDRKNIDRVDKAVERLKEILAVEIVQRYLDGNTPDGP